MKYVIITLITLASFNAHAACDIKGKRLSAKAKGVYINGVSLSKSVREALTQYGCKITSTPMSLAEKKAHYKAQYERKLSKLK